MGVTAVSAGRNRNPRFACDRAGGSSLPSTASHARQTSRGGYADQGRLRPAVRNTTVRSTAVCRMGAAVPEVPVATPSRAGRSCAGQIASPTDQHCPYGPTAVPSALQPFAGWEPRCQRCLSPHPPVRAGHVPARSCRAHTTTAPTGQPRCNPLYEPGKSSGSSGSVPATTSS